MPNRILKESICTSETINKLSMECEVFFYRLVVNADDYGRFDARFEIIKSRLFPLKHVEYKRIEKCLNELFSVGLIKFYLVKNAKYIQISNWSEHQRVRISRGKYPPPDENDNLQNFAASCGELPPESNTIQYNPNPNTNPNPKEEEKNPSPPSPKEIIKSQEDLICESDFPDQLKLKLFDWIKYKKERKLEYKDVGFNALLTITKKYYEKYGTEKVVDLITLCISNNWQGIQWDKLKDEKKGASNGSLKDTNTKPTHGVIFE